MFKNPFSAIAALIIAHVVLLIGVFAGCTSDGKLTPAAEAGFLNAEVQLCDTLVPLIPMPSGTSLPSNLPGLVAPLACSGSEQLLKMGLDKVTSVTSNVGTATAAMTMAKTSSATPLVKTSKGYAVFHRGKHVGFVPDKLTAVAFHTPVVQATCDAACALPDAGAK